MAIVDSDIIGTPDHTRNVNTMENWDKHYIGTMSMLDHQEMGIYEFMCTEVESDSTILDIGGSSGIGARYMKDLYPELDITVIELSSVACEVGSAKGCGVKFICDDIRTRDIGTDSCDYIVASHILEHVDDMDALMVKLMGAIRSYGTLYLVLPHEDDLYIWHQYRFTHDAYHFFRKYADWVSFSSSELLRPSGIDNDMYVRLVKV